MIKNLYLFDYKDDVDTQRRKKLGKFSGKILIKKSWTEKEKNLSIILPTILILFTVRC